MFPALITFPLLSPRHEVVTSCLAVDLAPEVRLVRPGLAATQASLSGHLEASTRREMELIRGESSVVLSKPETLKSSLFFKKITTVTTLRAMALETEARVIMRPTKVTADLSSSSSLRLSLRRIPSSRA